MKTEGFTQQELLPYVSTMVLCAVILIYNYRRGFRYFWSPLTIIVIVFSYYCLLGPYQAITSGNTYDRLINMRPFYVASFWGAFLSLLSCVVGFLANGRASRVIFYRDYMVTDLSYYGRRVFLLGLMLFTISTGGNILKLINPLDAEAVEQVGGSFANYFGLSVNFLIPGVVLLFAFFMKTRKGLLWFLICFVVAFALFTTLGFRWRIVMLFGGIAITYYLLTHRRPNIIVGVVGVFGFIVFMGLINLTRDYGKGLDLNKLQKKNSQSFYESGLSEAKIFQTSGAIIEIVPSKYPFAGIKPIVSTLLFPVPRALFAEKGSAEYLLNALNAIYGKIHSKGAAIMMYGEHYLAFGWLGIIGGAFILGWFYRSLWKWYLANADNPFAVVTYSITATYLYVILSRGYLPQVTMLFFFTVFPIYVVLRMVKKKYA